MLWKEIEKEILTEKINKILGGLSEPTLTPSDEIILEGLLYEVNEEAELAIQGPSSIAMIITNYFLKFKSQQQIKELFKDLPSLLEQKETLSGNDIDSLTGTISDEGKNDLSNTGTIKDKGNINDSQTGTVNDSGKNDLSDTGTIKTEGSNDQSNTGTINDDGSNNLSTTGTIKDDGSNNLSTTGTNNLEDVNYVGNESETDKDKIDLKFVRDKSTHENTLNTKNDTEIKNERTLNTKDDRTIKNERELNTQLNTEIESTQTLNTQHNTEISNEREVNLMNDQNNENTTTLNTQNNREIENTKTLNTNKDTKYGRIKTTTYQMQFIEKIRDFMLIDTQNMIQIFQYNVFSTILKSPQIPQRYNSWYGKF